ncbi:MAG: DNA-processing protein DprA [Saprospiraceae bacterium]|nr:DNA-processing protein DprA [Saprospiraceae bacterium]
MINSPEKQEETIFKIALSLVPKVGNKTALELIKYYGNALSIFEHSTLQELCQFSTIKPSSANIILKKKTVARAEKEWIFTQKYAIKILSQEMSEYPKRLRNCYDAPFLLYHKGTNNLNASKIVAIVGTRKPTEKGRAFCEQLVNDLACYNPLIVSGLAYGIDITAHKKCIDLSVPNIGVVAHGLDRIYPQKHKKTAQMIVENGGILTEFLSETEPVPRHFPMRNRIIAGMADAVVVVETATRGGSMITAHIANEYNKDVFAVPGRLDDKLSQGCNHLIKTHRASLLESADDIAYILRWKKQKAGNQKQIFTELNEQERKIIDLLVGQEDVHLDSIINNTGISTSRIASLLLELEFKGLIRAIPGKRFRLI